MEKIDDFNAELLDNNSLIVDSVEFLKLQNLYRNSLEKIIKNVINIDEYNNRITNLSFNVPIVNDNDFNIYRKYSNLGSDYFYLRNNIHIERLNKQDLIQLKNNLVDNKELNIEFLSRTLSILFEPGKVTNYLFDSEEYFVNSKSLVFEFAFDANQINDLGELINIEDNLNIISKEFSAELNQKLGIQISSYVYNSIPVFYKTKNDYTIINTQQTIIK